MAPKRSPLEDPPAAASDEEIGSEDSEESEGEEEEEEVKGSGENDSESDESDEIPKSASKTQKPPSSDDEGEESESESEEEELPEKSKPSEVRRNPSGSGKSVKPLSETSKPKKTVTKPTAAAAPPPKSSSSGAAAKRPLESEKSDKDSKRKKKKVGGGDADDDEEGDHQEEVKNNPFARLWSEDDEIVILKHMSDCKKQGIDAYSDLPEFLDSVKKSLHFNVNVAQLSNKVKRLKKKFQNNFKRGKSGGDPVFSKPHDIRCYDLMKEIWGEEEAKSKKASQSNNGGDDSALSNGKRIRKPKSRAITTTPKTISLNDTPMKDLPESEAKNKSLYPCLTESMQIDKNKNLPMVGNSLFKEGLSLIGESKAEELEQKWRKLQTQELEVYLKRIELVREQTIEVLKALNSAD